MQNKNVARIKHKTISVLVKRRQFLLYTTIGLSGVTIDYIAYLFGVNVLGLGILLANFISISLGILNNFILNTKYNFKKTDRLLIRFLLFYAVGFLGLILSEILILLFYNGLHTSAAVAKLLTLPFVLIVQYIINKHVSFGNINHMIRKFKRLSWHWPLYVLVIIFATSSLFLARNIPTDYASKSLALRPSYAPDESVHYNFNVRFIIKNKRLPISGKDDLGAYKSCSPEHIAKVHCAYSYVVFPAASYVLDAMSSMLLHKLIGAPYVMGARIPSVIFGLIFIISAYFSAFIISKRRLIATLTTIAVGFIPEYIFTSSYINLDAHSVAISGLLGLAVVNYLFNENSKRSLIFLGIALGGLLPLAKYNFYILGIPIIGLLIYQYLTSKIQIRNILWLLFWSFIGFSIFSAYWFIRNLVLYNDPFGQTFVINEMSKYYPLGKSIPLNLKSILLFDQLDFFGKLFRSYYYAFGGMIYYLGNSVYTTVGFATIVGITWLVARIATVKALRPVLYAFVAYTALWALALAQVLYNSLVYDYQPQGRYLFPMLIPTVIFLAYCARKDKELEKLSILFAAITLFVFISSIGLTLQLYLHV